MKISKRLNLFLLAIILFFFFFLGGIFPKQAHAQTCENWCTSNLCASDWHCAGCCFCPGQPPCPTSRPPQPTEAKEDIEGKIYNPVLPVDLSTTTGATFLQKLIKAGISLVLITGAVIFFFILTSGGIRWLSSSGDKVKLESAQKQISSGLVGLAILLSSFAVIKLIEALFGIDLLNITLPTL